MVRGTSERETKATQRARILRLLIQSGDWVPLPRLVQIAAQYSARVYELRRLGFTIANKTRVVDGKRHSWFRLRTDPTSNSNDQTDRCGPATKSSPTTFPEFGDMTPPPRYPD